MLKNLPKREWAFGTVIRCEVIDVSTRGRYCLTICKSDEYPGEAFVLLAGAGENAAAVGDRGTLTFMPGGPHGGHFIYKPRTG